MSYVVNALAIFRLTRLLMLDDCPYELCAKLRDEIGIAYTSHNRAYGKNEIAKVFLCHYCLSFWVGLFVARGNIKEALAYSGASALMFKWVDG